MAVSSEFLYLRLPVTDQGTYEYAISAAGSGGDVQHGYASAAQVKARAVGRRCVAIVPGYEVLITQTWLPTRRSSRITQALPYALEEQLTSEIDELHFAIRRVEGDGRVHAAVVEHAAMQRWQEELAGLGVEVVAIVPESGLLAVNERRWQVLADEQRVVLALGGEGFALEPATAPVALEAALASTAQLPEQIEIEAPDGLLQRLEAVPATLSEPPQVTGRETRSPLLVRLMERFELSRAVDLLQGPYAQRERWGWLWRPLRPAAALFGAWLLIQVVLQVVEVYRLEARSDELSSQIEQVYRQTFPDGRVVNPRVQMEQHLRALRGGNGNGAGQALLSRLLARAAPALAGDGLRVRTLRLRDGALEVELNTTDIESLESLRTSLEEGGSLEVEIRSATAREGRVAGRLVIREGAV